MPFPSFHPRFCQLPFQSVFSPGVPKASVVVFVDVLSLRQTPKTRTNCMVKCSFRRSFPALSRFVGFALLIGMVIGCGRQDVSVYDVPKETKGPSGASASLPPGWEELPGDQMRI